MALPPPHRRRLTVTATNDALAHARRWIRQIADDSFRHRLDDLQLMVSELVANSIAHAGLRQDDRIELIAEETDGVLRITVRDGGRGFPAGWRQARAGDGLRLVGRLADDLVIDPRQSIVTVSVRLT